MVDWSTLNDPYSVGYRAGAAGASRATCPYKPTDLDGKEWVKGQLCGERDRRRFEGTLGASVEEVARCVADFKADGYGDELAAVAEVAAPEPPVRTDRQVLMPTGEYVGIPPGVSTVFVAVSSEVLADQVRWDNEAMVQQWCIDLQVRVYDDGTYWDAAP